MRKCIPLQVLDGLDEFRTLQKDKGFSSSPYEGKSDRSANLIETPAAPSSRIGLQSKHAFLLRTHA